jgi:hypothetical protein
MCAVELQRKALVGPLGELAGIVKQVDDTLGRGCERLHELKEEEQKR